MCETVGAELEKLSRNVVDVGAGRVLDLDLVGVWRYKELLQPPFAFAAVLPWTYFADAIRASGTRLVNESG